MKKILLGLIILCFSTISFAQSIVAHWNNANAKNEELGHPIKKVGNVYKTVGEDGEYSLAVTVDEKNGYLTFSDPGTGGGLITVEAAIFKGTGKSFLVYKTFITDGFGELKIGAFAVEDGYTPANEIFPKFDLNLLFFNDKVKDLSEEDANYIKALFNLDFKVPRYGTVAKYVINKTKAKESCEGMSDHPACKYVNAAQYNEVQLNWLKDENRFFWTN